MRVPTSIASWWPAQAERRRSLRRGRFSPQLPKNSRFGGYFLSAMIEYLHIMQINPPTKEIARAFGSSVEPERLEGGQGTSYRSGEIMLKPADSAEYSEWIAELFSSLPASPGVRFARPIKSSSDEWIYDGYVGWEFLEGEHIEGYYHDKLIASKIFHKSLAGVAKPKFLATPTGPWSAADQIVWQGSSFEYSQEFMDLINQITPHLKPVDGSEQLIHGDLLGNFLISDNLSPAIIDFSPVWAPVGFAEGIMLVDAITWEGATATDLAVFNSVPNIVQFAWRGVFRRIAEQAEQIKWLNKDKNQAIEAAQAFQVAINYLTLCPPTAGTPNS